ncbi:MAG: MFS transporter [Thermoflexaceae bacterium]|nr:MFS transporter [Thermoflexaceae bacterium]
MATPAFPIARNTWLYYAFAFFMQSGLWFGIWIKYLLDTRGFELRWIFLMDLPFWLAMAALQAPLGALADHIGRRKVLVMGAAAYAVTILGFGFTTTYWMLFADYMLWAVALAATSGADEALMFDSLKAAGREERFQHIIGRNFAVTLTGGFIGVAAGGFVAQWTSLAFTVQVSALFPVAAIVVALLMVEPPRERSRQPYLRGLRDGLSFAWNTPQVRYTVLFGSVVMTGTFGPVILMQPFLIDHDIATEWFGLFQAPIRLTAVIAAFLTGAVAMRVGRSTLFLAGPVAIASAYLLLGLIDRPWAFALFAAPALVQALVNPAISAHLNERIPSDRRATVLSVLQLAFSLQVAFFEPGLGFIADGVSMVAALFFAAAYLAILVPPLLLLWRRAHPGGVGVQAVSAMEPAAP